MKERLLFYGVNVERDHTVIDKREQNSSMVLSDVADADPSGRDEASMSTQVADHCLPFGLFI
jgi:hypothetical protein